MRGKKIKKVILAPDPRYGSAGVAKFINYVMRAGKKSVAQKIVYGALDKISAELKKEPTAVFDEAIKNVEPQVEVRSKRVGGANYQVPLPVRGERQFALACRWIIGAARSLKGQEMEKKLARVLLDSYNNTGEAVKKRDEVHRMAEANKAFAHFARFAK